LRLRTPLGCVARAEVAASDWLIRSKLEVLALMSSLSAVIGTYEKSQFRWACRSSHETRPLC